MDSSLPDNPEKYRRIKKMSFLSLKSEKRGEKERMALYDDHLMVTIVALVFLAESMKNFYFGYQSLSLEQRLLFGDIIISDKQDQRLWSLILSIDYLTAFLYVCSNFLNKQKVHLKRFNQLSKFLWVLDSNEYGRRFLVSKAFASEFSNELDKQVRLTWTLIFGYDLLTLSFYLTSIIQAFALWPTSRQVLVCLCSIILGSLAFMFFYSIAVQAYTFYIIYLKLLNARMRNLTGQLNKLVCNSNNRPIFKHRAKLNKVLGEFNVSYRFFGRSLNLLLPPVIICMYIFPMMVILSGNLFTNRLIGLYLLNLTQILYPIIKSNETFKREVGHAFRKFQK